jgi:hypothetical protein
MWGLHMNNPIINIFRFKSMNVCVLVPCWNFRTVYGGQKPVRIGDLGTVYSYNTATVLFIRELTYSNNSPEYCS